MSPDLRTVILTIANDRKKYREAGKFSFPYGVACDNEDNIFIVDTNNKRLVQINKDGKFMKEIFPAGLSPNNSFFLFHDEVFLYHLTLLMVKIK